ncbi:Glycosyl transferase [hydrothermal vent metagenome]|uniref:Glycosyl transferase n=1 Tax=hydrothermal vent metagenome TaxID=652676 RepID=A0A3B1C4P2_9ZZZZ
MGNKEIRVLHIDSELKWGGGQQQAIYLFEGMLNKGYYASFVCRPKSELKRYLKKHKLPYFEFKMSSEIDILSSYKIASFCKKNKINILYLHSAGAHAIGLMAKVFYPELKIIVVRRVSYDIRKNYLSQLKYKSSLINMFVCISNDIKNVLLRNGINKEKLRVIHDGIDLNKFTNIKSNSNLRKELEIPESDIVIGTIAALEGAKDYPNLLNSAKIVLQKVHNVSFVAIGDGRDRYKIKELHNKLNLGKKFIFTGFQDDVSKYLLLFDIFVLASKEEGLGTSILDAQSLGLPVVATKAGGIPEVVKHNINGVLVNPQNPQELASAIIDLVDDKAKREQLGRNGKESVKDFDINLNVKRHIDLINSMLNVGDVGSIG